MGRPGINASVLLFCFLVWILWTMLKWAIHCQRMQGHPSPRPMMHIAYFPLFPQNLSISPYFRQIHAFPFIFAIFYVFLLNLCFLPPSLFWPWCTYASCFTHTMIYLFYCRNNWLMYWMNLKKCNRIGLPSLLLSYCDFWQQILQPKNMLNNAIEVN